MPSPSTSLASLRPDLAGSMMEYDLEAAELGFVGLDIFPSFETEKKSGTFGRIPLEQLLQARDTARASGGSYNRGNFTFGKETFACIEHGLEEPVDDDESEMYAEFFDAELVATQRCRDGVLRNHEQRVIDKVTDTGIWTGAALTTAIGTAWTVIATATPIVDIRDAVLKVYDNSGLMANAVILSWKRFQVLKDVVEIIDRIKYSGHQDPKRLNITMQALADLFGVQKLIVAGGQKNTADEGQNASLASLWPDARAMICRVAVTGDIREPCIGRSLHWGGGGSQIGGVVESYRDETVRSDIIRHRMDTDEKRLYIEAGHLLTGI